MAEDSRLGVLKVLVYFALLVRKLWYNINAKIKCIFKKGKSNVNAEIILQWGDTFVLQTDDGSKYSCGADAFRYDKPEAGDKVIIKKDDSGIGVYIDESIVKAEESVRSEKCRFGVPIFVISIVGIISFPCDIVGTVLSFIAIAKGYWADGHIKAAFLLSFAFLCIYAFALAFNRS